MIDATKRWLLLGVGLAAATLAGGACSNSSNTSSTISPTTVVTPTTETFSGSIGRNESAVFPFTVKADGYALMAGISSITPGSVTALGLGIASWNATTATCGLNQTQSDAAKAGSTALSGTASAGNYCVRVYDAGNVPEGQTVSFAVQVEHY